MDGARLCYIHRMCCVIFHSGIKYPLTNIYKEGVHFVGKYRRRLIQYKLLEVRTSQQGFASTERSSYEPINLHYIMANENDNSSTRIYIEQNVRIIKH